MLHRERFAGRSRRRQLLRSKVGPQKVNSIRCSMLTRHSVNSLHTRTTTSLPHIGGRRIRPVGKGVKTDKSFVVLTSYRRVIYEQTDKAFFRVLVRAKTDNFRTKGCFW